MFFFSSLCDLFCVILFLFFFLMIRRPPRSTRTDTLFPYTTLFRSSSVITLLSYNRNGTAYVTVNHDALDHRWLIGGVEKARLLAATGDLLVGKTRSEEHTSELQSLMRISYAVFCLKKTHEKIDQTNIYTNIKLNQLQTQENTQ